MQKYELCMFAFLHDGSDRYQNTTLSTYGGNSEPLLQHIVIKSDENYNNITVESNVDSSHSLF